MLRHVAAEFCNFEKITVLLKPLKVEKFDHVGGGFTGFVLRGFRKKLSTVGHMKCLISELGKPMIPKKKHNFWYYLHLEKNV